MRCKKHPSDLSSTVGVCASCLSERLMSLIAAQAQSHAQLRTAVEDRRKSDPHPPPLLFPRSVSPYISHRKSNDTCYHLQHPVSDRRFHSTPQVGSTTASIAEIGSCKKKHSRFSLLSNLFRSRSDKSQSDPKVPRDPCATSTSSPSWFQTVLSGSRKNRSIMSPGDPRPSRARDRGMSPERGSNDAENYDELSGYSSESSQGWKRTPVAGPGNAVRRGRPCQNRNVSGLTFCLSPLVRASPNRQWNQKSLPPEIGYSCDIRVPAKPHLSAAASFCANRSRKLTDFGRVNHNR